MSAAEMVHFVWLPYGIVVAIATLFVTHFSGTYIQALNWNQGRSYRGVEKDSGGKQTYGMVSDRMLSSSSRMPQNISTRVTEDA